MPRQRSLGRYEVLIELARGGMAELCLGRLHGAGGFAKLVALKRILPHLAQDRQFTEMFLDEGRIAARLSHPNVCQVFELDEVDGELFLAMEYLDGVAWDHLSAAVDLGPRRGEAMVIAVGVLAQAAEGLQYAHTLRDLDGTPTPVVHRDVSPQNLFVTVDGVCKLLDFGVSKMMTDGPRTKSGVIKGKLPYMAPEQIRGEPVDARADVFSLGVCAWEALAGERLFERGSDYQIWKAITEEDVPAIASRWSACPPLVDAVVARALAREPARRQSSARGFAEELVHAAGGAASPGAIAAALRGCCGDRLAERARQVAEAVAGLAREPAVDEVASGMRLRRGSVAVRRDDDAAETRDFRGSDAAETRDFAGSAAAAPPAVHEPRATAVRRDEPARPPARRGHLMTAIIAGLVAAALTAVIVVVATRGGRERAPVASAPPDAAARARFGNFDRLRDDLTQLRDSLAPFQRLADDDAEDAEPGHYAIDSKPAAKIYAGDKLLGETPLRMPLPPGPHAIRAVLEDGRERTFSITIRAGEDTNAGELAW